MWLEERSFKICSQVEVHSWKEDVWDSLKKE